VPHGTYTILTNIKGAGNEDSTQPATKSPSLDPSWCSPDHILRTFPSTHISSVNFKPIWLTIWRQHSKVRAAITKIYLPLNIILRQFDPSSILTIFYTKVHLLFFICPILGISSDHLPRRFYRKILHAFPFHIFLTCPVTTSFILLIS
jgi:hypothetical protein